MPENPEKEQPEANAAANDAATLAAHSHEQVSKAAAEAEDAVAKAVQAMSNNS